MNSNKGSSQFKVGELDILLNWEYKDSLDTVVVNISAKTNSQHLSDSFELLPRYPHTIEFVGRKIRFSFVDTKYTKKLYVAVPNQKNTFERQTLSSWYKAFDIE